MGEEILLLQSLLYRAGNRKGIVLVGIDLKLVNIGTLVFKAIKCHKLINSCKSRAKVILNLREGNPVPLFIPLVSYIIFLVIFLRLFNIN